MVRFGPGLIYDLFQQVRIPVLAKICGGVEIIGPGPYKAPRVRNDAMCKGGRGHHVFLAGFIQLHQPLFEVAGVNGSSRPERTSNVLESGGEPVLQFVMVHDGQGWNSHLLEASYYLLGGRSLAVHVNRSGVLAQVRRAVETDEFDPEQFHQCDILMMAYSAAVDDVALDIESAAYELMNESRGNGVRIGASPEARQYEFPPGGLPKAPLSSAVNGRFRFPLDAPLKNLPGLFIQ